MILIRKKACIAYKSAILSTFMKYKHYKSDANECEASEKQRRKNGIYTDGASCYSLVHQWAI